MINKEFNKIICKRVKQLRKNKKITMEKLAFQSDISKGGLSEIERCMKEPRLYTIAKICSALDISMPDFFNFKELNSFINNIYF